MNQHTFLDPSSKAYRFVVLAATALLTFGSYFAYDIIGAISNSLIEELGMSRTTVSTMYTAYSVAAVVAVFVAGFLVDRLGPRFSSMLFSILVTVGALIVALAPTPWMMMAGRFIFGAGSEPLVVAQMAITARWFKNKEMALAFGISLTVSRLGTLFAYNTGELIARQFGGPRYALYAAVIFCLVSLAGNVLYVFLDRWGEKSLELGTESATDKIVLSDVGRFSPSYWYVALLCLTFYSAIFPFQALAPDFFATKWGVAKAIENDGGFLYQVFSSFLHMGSTAGGLTSIIIFASMVCSPFAGHAVDKIGKRATLMVVGSLILIPSHLVMGFTQIYPVYPMIALGVAFVLVPAALWPSFPKLVKPTEVGTAYGVSTAIQNIGLAAFPSLNGWLRDTTQDYRASMAMFACLGVLGLVFSLLLLRSDRRAGGLLEQAKAADA